MSLRSKKALPFIAIGFSVLYGLVLLFGGPVLLGTMWIILGLLLTILIGLIALMAGVVVIKSVFIVAAELSLLIFLTQSFCASSTRLAQNNAAMTSLFTVGIVYIGFIFGRSLWEILKTNYKKLEHEPRPTETIVMAISFLFFIGLFLWELYLIISPIIANLCVYK